VSIGRRGEGDVGSGGPNQEVALGFARAVAGAGPVVGVFVDSDGLDGGTYAAGGCVDSATATCAETLGIDLDDALEHHDAGSALERIGDLLVTGPTGTNISDLIVVVLGAEPAGVAS
jgi:glycerate 2-kinase